MGLAIPGVLPSLFVADPRNHSSNRITVPDCIFQPFQEYCVDSLSLNVAVSLGIERVAFARRRKMPPSLHQLRMVSGFNYRMGDWDTCNPCYVQG